jgi:hypothetical protein
VNVWRNDATTAFSNKFGPFETQQPTFGMDKHDQNDSWRRYGLVEMLGGGGFPTYRAGRTMFWLNSFCTAKCRDDAVTHFSEARQSTQRSFQLPFLFSTIIRET